MEKSQEERAITEALDETLRRDEPLREAKGSWRLSWDESGPALAAALLLFTYFTSHDAVDLAYFGGVLLIWHDKRIAARLDAVVRLLDREA